MKKEIKITLIIIGICIFLIGIIGGGAIVTNHNNSNKSDVTETSDNIDLSNLKQYIGDKIENEKAIEMLNIIKKDYNLYLSNATGTGKKNSVELIIYFSNDIEKNTNEIVNNAIISMIDSYITTREYDKDYGYFKITTGIDSKYGQFINIYKVENSEE